ncbi:MAG: dephospho-CoA kinase [marine bacterium B5-7]|nr:MAG: dephospho-CoA kinase [marine bacterium B5-7]
MNDRTPYRVGLTGGIGSGKTTVSNRFATLGVDIIDADVIAHTVTAPGQPLVDKIADVFGTNVIANDGSLDRAALRRLVFNTPTSRARLEALVHPVVRRTMDDQVKASHSAYCILSIPLLAESKDTTRVDRILVVDAPDTLRRQWITLRSNLNDDEIDAIFSSQASRVERLAIADDVIVNDGSLEDLYRQVDQLHLVYLEIANTTEN